MSDAQPPVNSTDPDLWVRYWLASALECKAFAWDEDQREAAQKALEAANTQVVTMPIAWVIPRSKQFSWEPQDTRYWTALIPAPCASTYTTQPGESLAGIALRQLGDENRWCEIDILNADRFPRMLPHEYYPVGTVLRMPYKS